MSFSHTTLPVIDKQVFRLGLAGNFGIDEAGVRDAVDRGVNYFYWTPRMKKVTPVLTDLVRSDRDRIVLATGPTTAWWPGNVRSFVDKTLASLGTDHLDLLLAHWAGVTAALTDGMFEELVRLREQGKVRAVGVSIHNRERTGRLAQTSPLDAFMIRYNAAHPGAERDIFPHLEQGRHAVISYTATRWRKLLKRPRGWEGEVPTAGHCYRFCLSNPHVHVTLTGPKTREQLAQNLAAIEQGPLSDDEEAWMREFGRVVHG